jgi:hypothetical protein
MNPATKIHYDYARYVVTHGTREERRNLKQTLGVMGELIAAFPSGSWEPMEGVYLIDHLLERAELLAQRRWDAAHKQRYGDHQGKVGRTFEEERQTVRGHLAAQIMLGLPLGKPDTYQEARMVGNIGGGNEAFIPFKNPLAHKLIVDPRTADEITSWLVVPEGERAFRLSGWIVAREAKQDVYRHERTREGGKSVAYWVPPSALHTVEEWWNRN